MFSRRVEEVSLNAWPALQQMFYDGWILRFSRGYTKRANSVNPLYGSSLSVSAKIEVCEALYAEKGLPTIFRITPFAWPPDLDEALERRRYKKFDATLVLHRELEGQEFRPAPPVTLRDEPLDHWINLFCELQGVPLSKQQVHKEILQAIPARRFLALLADEGQVVACGVGVLEQGYFGLFDLITAPRHRNKGHGTRLVAALLNWAQANAARHAYLQVVSTNAPARHLYETKFGFQEVYRYWYRMIQT